MFKVFLKILNQSSVSMTWLMENYYLELPYFHHPELTFLSNLTRDIPDGMQANLALKF